MAPRSLCWPTLVLALLSSASPAKARQPARLATTDPVSYLNQALAEIQKHALRVHDVNWPIIRTEALRKANHAVFTVDTYDAIRFALSSLGDHHSSFHPTPALEQLEAKRKGRPVANEDESKSPPNPFVGRYEPEGTNVSAKGKRFAIVVVSKCFPENEKQFVGYESRLQKIFATLDKTGPDGWVLDLRGNVGGNMWPMLVGIGPLLGESDHLGEFFTTTGHSVWTYHDGVAAEVDDRGKRDAYPRIDGVAYRVKSSPQVAVLIDNRTGSSGEAVAIALRGRPKTRFFGEHTQGLSTVNEVFELPDGAAMWLTVGVDADRTGKQYPNGIDPDEFVKGDAVLQRALAWLGRDR